MKTKIKNFIVAKAPKKNMLKILGTLLIGVSTIFNAAAQKTEVRSVNEFTGIVTSGSISVYVIQGSTNGLRIEADEAILPDIKTEVKNGVLKIANKHNYKWFYRKRHFPIKAYVTTKDLNMINLSGASNIKGETTIKTDKMKIDLSGASNMHLTVEANEIDADISGASDVKISGTVRTIEVEVSGASSFKALDLESSTAKVVATGASKIEVNTKDDLQAHASGASKIVYKDTPERKNITASGASSVSGY